jgi:serine/threonine-protein kinase
MVRGNDLDSRGDLYSVGVVLFEMLTGRRPFLHSDIEELMLAHANEQPPSFASIGVRDVSPAIESVVMNCLAKYPEERPKTAWELALAYEKALGRRITHNRAGHPNTPGSGIRPTITPVASGSSRNLAVTPPPPAPTAPPSDRNAIRHSVEATMPEAMALIKVKGFVCDLGGEIVESVPGMIKVRLMDRPPEKKSGLFAWLTGSKSRQVTVQSAQATEIELHMERLDPNQQSKLTITLVMRPRGGMATADWRNRCNQIGRDLQAYLMGR